MQSGQEICPHCNAAYWPTGAAGAIPGLTKALEAKDRRANLRTSNESAYA